MSPRLLDGHVAEQVVFGRLTVLLSPPAAWAPAQALRAAAGLRRLESERQQQIAWELTEARREPAEARRRKHPPRPRSQGAAREPRTREHAIMQQAAQSLRALEERGARTYLRAEQREWLPSRPLRWCTLCQEESQVLYLVAPSRRKDPSDDARRLCVSCYLAFYGGTHTGHCRTTSGRSRRRTRALRRCWRRRARARRRRRPGQASRATARRRASGMRHRNLPRLLRCSSEPGMPVYRRRPRALVEARSTRSRWRASTLQPGWRHGRRTPASGPAASGAALPRPAACAGVVDVDVATFQGQEQHRVLPRWACTAGSPSGITTRSEVALDSVSHVGCPLSR